MATESLLNIDIGPLQGDLLREKKSQDQQPCSEHDLDRVDIAAAANKKSPSQAGALESQLPSTVPDSQLNRNFESQWIYLPPAPVSHKTTATRQKMTTQSSDDATQELSQSHYDLILSRSRNEGQLQEQEQSQALHQVWERDFDRGDDAGETQHEGDTGFIDLMSSFEEQKQGEEPEAAVEQTSEHDQRQRRTDSDKEREHELEGSEPIEVDFSPTQPTQSHAALSQFPESQRVKTPVTAGKKRRYNGDFIDSPDLPRNTRPLLRGGEDNAIPMGLSQAFGATQANTSPFVGNVGIGDLDSDRPSPDIHLQPRPMTATSSSPMRPLSTIKRPDRAGTEPLDHYISSKESQARREDARRKQLEDMNVKDGSSGEDDFDIQEDSWYARDRRERERSRRIQAQLSSSSPPAPFTRGVSLSKSSPIRPSARRSSPIRMRSSRQPRPNPESSPTRLNPQSQVTESEEETEQEDNKDMAPTSSSQSSAPVDEEDKENVSDRAIQIPATTIQLRRLTQAPPSQVQESPLLRRGRTLDEGGLSMTLNSSQAFAVADSQPERATKPPQAIAQVPRSSAADDGPDFVPQSPETTPQPTAPVSRNHPSAALPTQVLVSTAEQQGDAVIESVVPVSSSQARQPPNSTIPETSSNAPQDRSGKESEDTPQTCDVESRPEFETAETHVQPSSSTVAHQPTAVELSSPPISTTPPGRRRQRLSDIQGDPSPQKSQSSFDATAHLRLEIQRSPTLLRISARAAKKTRLPELATESARNGVSAQGDVLYRASESPKIQDEANNGDEAQPQHGLEKQSVQPALPGSTFPKRDKRSTATGLSARSSEIGAAPPRRRTSQYELPESPERRVDSSSKRTAKLKRKIESTGNPSDSATNANKRLKLTKSNPSPHDSLPSTPAQPQDMPDPLASDNQDSRHSSPRLESDKDVTNGVGEDLVAPNMVFAAFNGKSRTYHPALCLGRPATDSSRFTIQWEGYDPDEVDEHGVRSLDLRIGDQVKIDMEGFPKVSHVIRGFTDRIPPDNVHLGQVIVTDIRGYQTLVVAPKQRKSLPVEISTEAVKNVPVSAIYLDTIMWGQMKDRVYECNSAVYQGRSTDRSTPVPQISSSSRPSPPPSRSRRGVAVAGPTISTIYTRPDGLFSNMMFAISHYDEPTKQRLVSLVQENGGSILEGSFTDLFVVDSVELKDQYADVGFTALLTDRHMCNVKYLQALALGLPCLSGRWIEASVQTGRLADWNSYLLAAGESTELEGAVKSRLLQLPSSIQGLKVRDMLDLRPKILHNSRVVFVMGKGKTSEDRKPILFLVRALGPSQLTTETNVSGAKEIVQSTDQSKEPVDYVFVGDGDVQAAKRLFSSGATEPKEEQKRLRKGKPKNGRVSGRYETEAKQELDGVLGRAQIICKEDIIQSLILGRLWIGGT
ncbi:DNA repair protein RAD9 [Cladophialophora carrionii]|uniref:DNA repair protein RAD9 n=1 Tax=Cladophialophora carrionii TaxID=86049 RepID=A0A1C1CVS6_9EURO|nr:DNA repair protein RAD9 [Cladophialophora carrionii]